MTNLSKTYIPIGIAVSAVLLLSGFVWQAASWTTQTDGRLAAIETKLTTISQQLEVKLSKYESVYPNLP